MQLFLFSTLWFTLGPSFTNYRPFKFWPELRSKHATRTMNLRAMPEMPNLANVQLPQISMPTVSQSVVDHVVQSFLDAVIAWGVPALVFGVAAATAASRLNRDASLRRAPVGLQSSSSGRGLGALFSGRNENEELGAPKEYLTIERLNDRLDSFTFSLEKATVAPAAALAAARRRDLQRRFGNEIGSLDDEKLALFATAEETYRKDAAAAAEAVSDATKNLRLKAVDAGEKAASETSNVGLAEMGMFKDDTLEREMQRAIAKSVQVEATFLQQISKALGRDSTETRRGLSRLVTERPLEWNPGVSPLELPSSIQGGVHHKEEVPSDDSIASGQHFPSQSPCWFVLEFFGDVQASQVNALRQEVTAIVGHARASNGDGVVVILNSGGGTVTGYGLAAAQLQRIKYAGLKLVICVEQIAASGGYMMACVADRLIASPFAVLGSIGVITDIPNLYERLLKEGIEFQTVTAGQFKRTLTPTKKVTAEDVQKTKEDIEDVFRLFKTFVGENRPQLDLESVATGETWFGKDALDRNLVDELKTSDDLLLELRREGAEIFSVKYNEPPSNPVAAIFGSRGVSGANMHNLPAREMDNMSLLSWLIQSLLDTLQTGARKRGLSPDALYRAEDYSSQELRIEGTQPRAGPFF